MKLLLDIDPTASPVRGTLCDEHGEPQPFTGWTQFGALLDSAISGASQRQAAPDADPEPKEAQPC